jgi:spore germination cell wall hydrolase CwlJ-like protein
MKRKIYVLAMHLFSSPLLSATFQPEESTCLAKIIYAEARGEPRESQVGVAYTVKNRRLKARNKSICQIARSRAYVSRNIRNPKNKKYFGRMARKVLTGEIPNNVKNATHFVATTLQRKPKWYNKKNIIAKYGRHEFLALKAES